MSEEPAQVEQYLKTTRRMRRRATQIFLVVLLICAAVVLPPFINISRYQRQITALMTRSLGRPVRLSSVNLRLLPRPGFVLNDLSVGETQEFGVEPILSAESVVASIRLSALLTGKVEVDRISLDNASLNLVQSTPGRWNVEQFMMGGLVQGMNQTAPTAAQPVFRRQPAAFPYLEAHNSRVNIKHGLEKLPYSLTNTQLSFWQESPGVWRLRLRGQPSRTDMEISAGDTGDLRLEGTLQTLPGRGLYQMPLKIQAAWREAQLGQLSRLLLGSDQGWRGDITADLNIQGTADSAQTEARLRATSVRREEFVPASPMDFDIHCGLLYQHSQRAVRNLACNTGIGGGKLAIKADLPGDAGEPEATLTVDSLPLQAGLDMLRTVRNGFAPNISADGKVSGELHLSPQPPAPVKAAKPAAHNAAAPAKPTQPAQPAFQGELTIADGALRGGPLSHPIPLPKMILTAAEAPARGPGNTPAPALTTRFPLALAAASSNQPGAAPASNSGSPAAVHAQELNVRLQLTSDGYEVAMNGSAAPERLRELVYALGVKRTPALDSISGGQADLDGVAEGPWISSPDWVASQERNAAGTQTAQPTAPLATTAPISKPALTKAQGKAQGKPLTASMPRPGSLDDVTGAVHLHRVAWSAPYLAHSVEFPEATINFAGNTASASGSFTYGALAGTAALNQMGCSAAGCSPQIEIHLRDTDAATIEGALLGAQEKKSLLSPLIDRVRNSQRTPWPEASVTIAADSLMLGPITLHKPVLAMKITGKGLTLENWQANLLGGEAKGIGSGAWNGNQLAYTVEGSFNNLSGAQLGQLLEHPRPALAVNSTESDAENDAQPGKEPVPAAANASLWSGGPVDGSGKVELSGLTANELAASASGALHFHWLKGSVPVAATPVATAPPTPASATQPTDSERPAAIAAHFTSAHFAAWTGDATIGSGKITLGNNALTGAPHQSDSASVTGSIPFGGPSRLSKSSKPVEAQASAKAAAKP